MVADRRRVIICGIVVAALRAISVTGIGVTLRHNAAILIQSAVGAPMANTVIRRRPLVISYRVRAGNSAQLTSAGGSCSSRSSHHGCVCRSCHKLYIGSGRTDRDRASVCIPVIATQGIHHTGIHHIDMESVVIMWCFRRNGLFRYESTGLNGRRGFVKQDQIGQCFAVEKGVISNRLNRCGKLCIR